MQEVTQLTQVTLLTNSTKHKPSNLKQVMQKNGSHEFPEFLLEKFRNFGTWGKTEFPEIRKSEFPELQSLLTKLIDVKKGSKFTLYIFMKAYINKA